jgi:sugar phosphate isomerase/epimerase
MCAVWGGHEQAWANALDISGLMDYVTDLGLEGLQITAADCGSTDPGRLKSIRSAAHDRGLYLEYNFSLDEKYDPRLTHTLEQGVRIAEALGADVAKVSMDLKRPHPILASRFHPDVMQQLEVLSSRLKTVATIAAEAGIRIAIENHTDCFSEEILWLLDRVDHPHVGACVDTVNAFMVGEDPVTAVENLAPKAFSNHFRDGRIEILHDGFRLTGAALGDGDMDLKRAYRIITDQSTMKRINIETDVEGVPGDREASLRMEREALERSVRFCRDVLGI